MEKKLAKQPTSAPSAQPTEGTAGGNIHVADASRCVPTGGGGCTAAGKTAKVAPQMKIKGTLTIIDADAHDYEFRAQRTTGVSTQEVLKTSGQSKLYRTTGEKDPKLVAKLSVNADSPDPAADLQQQLSRVTKGMTRKQPAPLKGRTLLSQDGISVVLNNEKKLLECRLTMPVGTPAGMQQQIIKHMQTLSLCLVTNQDSLNPRKS